MSPWMDVTECAKHLRPSKPLNCKTLYRWAKKGLIPAHKLNGVVMFHREEVDKHVASNAAVEKPASLTPFEQARLRARSLKTEHTERRQPKFQKGTG